MQNAKWNVLAFGFAEAVEEEAGCADGEVLFVGAEVGEGDTVRNGFEGEVLAERSSAISTDGGNGDLDIVVEFDGYDNAADGVVAIRSHAEELKREVDLRVGRN